MNSNQQQNPPRTPDNPDIEKHIFSENFIKQFEEQEEELYKLQQYRQELRDEVKYFHMNQPRTEDLQNCIQELLQFFADATSELHYGQYLPKETPADIIKTLQQFEKDPIQDPHFKRMLFDLKLFKYEKILNIVDKNSRSEVTDSAVVDLEKVYNDTKTRSERAQAKEERENDVMDEDICLEPLFSAGSKSFAVSSAEVLRIQQGHTQQNSNNFQPGPSNVQKHMSQNISQHLPQNIPHNIPHNIPQNIPQNTPQNITQHNSQNIAQNSSHQKNKQNQRHRNDTLTGHQMEF